MEGFDYSDALALVEQTLSHMFGNRVTHAELRLWDITDNPEQWAAVSEKIAFIASNRTGLFDRKFALAQQLRQLTLDNTLADVAGHVLAWSLAGDKNPPRP